MPWIISCLTGRVLAVQKEGAGLCRWIMPGRKELWSCIWHTRRNGLGEVEDWKSWNIEAVLRSQQCCNKAPLSPKALMKRSQCTVHVPREESPEEANCTEINLAQGNTRNELAIAEVESIHTPNTIKKERSRGRLGG